jgi:hypothetical protein
VIKIVTTLKKKAGMSTAAFRAYYEDHHRIIGEKYLQDFAVRYVRRYMNPLPNEQGKQVEPDFDVLLEIWFSDDTAYQACSQRLSEPAVAY